MKGSPTPLDRLLSVLKTPSLAGDLAVHQEQWDEIKRFAEIHRFSGLLAQSASAWLPPSERPWRDRVLMTHHRRHSQRLIALRRLAEAFDEGGIAYSTLKGPVLAERFYAEAFLRPSNDLDLLICERDVGAANRLMTRLGFELQGRYPWSLQRRISNHFIFSPTDFSPRVEMHYCLRVGRGALEPEELIERTVIWRSPSGGEYRALSAVDEAFFSCIHAANHAFHRLRWLYDSLVITRSLTPEGRVQVRHLAIDHGQTGLLLATALATEEFFDESLPVDCGGLATPRLWSRLSRAHTRKMAERVEGNTRTAGEKLGYRLDLMRMMDSPVEAVRLLALMVDCEVRRRWYELRHPAVTDVLTATLPN